MVTFGRDPHHRIALGILYFRIRLYIICSHNIQLSYANAIGLFNLWHYIENLSNDTVPNHTLITTNHQALFIYNRTKIAGWFPVFPLKKFASTSFASLSIYSATAKEQLYIGLFSGTVLNVRKHIFERKHRKSALYLFNFLALYIDIYW